MKKRQILLASILVTIFAIIFGIITCGGYFNWVYKLEPVNVWKPMTGTPQPIFFVAEFFLSMLFVIVYALFSKGIPGKNKYIKGLVYGLAVFSVGMLQGVFSTYFFMTVNHVVLIYWTIWGLIAIPAKGIITAAVYE